MTPFYEQFRDRIDPSDGSIVLLRDEYEAIQLEAYQEGRCDGLTQAAEIYTVEMRKSDPGQIGMKEMEITSVILKARDKALSVGEFVARHLERQSGAACNPAGSGEVGTG